MRAGFLGLIFCLLHPLAAAADDRSVRLYAPDALVETGLLQYILPRFSLKTQVRIALVGAGEAADLSFGPEGQALFTGAGATWHVQTHGAAHPGTERLLDWLTSEVGRNTVLSFAPEGEPLFAPPAAVERVVARAAPSGNVALGLAASQRKCARCHVVERGAGLSGIGSTPSFFVLRSLPDWQDRFGAFYALNPHPAFTQIEGVTAPFPEDRPSPIHPVTLSLDEVEAVLSYVAALEPADLGAPLQHQ